MKFLTVLLLTLGAFCGFDHLSASATTNDCNKQYFTCSWSGNEESLYLNIYLSNAFEFDDDYITRETEKGQVCEIVCRPIQDTIFSNEGYLLQKITLTVMLENTEDPSSVGYVPTEASEYEGINDEGRKK